MSKVKAAKKPAGPSASRDIVPVGPRNVSAKHQGKRDANGERPTTARALILRNGKHGARGTGELVVVSRISGREKLDLLAGEYPSCHTKSVPTFGASRGPHRKIQDGCVKFVPTGAVFKNRRVTAQW
jgi:hypothetical protein